MYEAETIMRPNQCTSPKCGHSIKPHVHSRRDHITNYWHYHWTNAFTESTNNSIKKIEKAGRGYKFDVLRDHCILSINNPAPDKFDFKKAVYIAKNKARDKSVMLRRRKALLYELASRIEHKDNMLDYIKHVGHIFKG